MQKLLFSILALFFLPNICSHAKESEITEAAGGQKIVKDFYESGILKTVTRYKPDGSLLAILYHDEKGIPQYADMYDGKLRSGKIIYLPNGRPKQTEHYDAKGKIRIAREFDEAGNVTSEKTFDE